MIEKGLKEDSRNSFQLSEIKDTRLNKFDKSA